MTVQTFGASPGPTHKHAHGRLDPLKDLLSVHSACLSTPTVHPASTSWPGPGAGGDTRESKSVLSWNLTCLESRSSRSPTRDVPLDRRSLRADVTLTLTVRCPLCTPLTLTLSEVTERSESISPGNILHSVAAAAAPVAAAAAAIVVALASAAAAAAVVTLASVAAAPVAVWHLINRVHA